MALAQVLEHAFKIETVGLVTREQFLEKRATIEQRCAQLCSALLLTLFWKGPQLAFQFARVSNFELVPRAVYGRPVVAAKLVHLACAKGFVASCETAEAC